jgi:hypothetical protein
MKGIISIEESNFKVALKALDLNVLSSLLVSFSITSTEEQWATF